MECAYKRPDKKKHWRKCKCSLFINVRKKNNSSDLELGMDDASYQLLKDAKFALGEGKRRGPGNEVVWGLAATDKEKYVDTSHICILGDTGAVSRVDKMSVFTVRSRRAPNRAEKRKSLRYCSATSNVGSSTRWFKMIGEKTSCA